MTDKTNRADFIALFKQAASYSGKYLDQNMLTTFLNEMNTTTKKDEGLFDQKQNTIHEHKDSGENGILHLDCQTAINSNNCQMDSGRDEKFSGWDSSCSIFRKSIKTEQAQRKYRSKEEQSKKYKCDQRDCEKLYATKQSLKIHLKKAHDIEDSSLHNIDVDRDFKSKVNQPNKNLKVFIAAKGESAVSEGLVEDLTDWKVFLVDNDEKSDNFREIDHGFDVNLQESDNEEVIDKLSKIQTNSDRNHVKRCHNEESFGNNDDFNLCKRSYPKFRKNENKNL